MAFGQNGVIGVNARLHVELEYDLVKEHVQILHQRYQMIMGKTGYHVQIYQQMSKFVLCRDVKIILVTFLISNQPFEKNFLFQL